MKRVLLLALVLASSCARQVPIGGLVVQGDATAVGAVVKVNGRVVGRLKEEWWVTASPQDSIFVDKPRGRVIAGSVLRRDSSLASRLDVRCPVGRGSQFVVVGLHGQRLETKADLGESTEVWVSFADKTLRVQPIDEAGLGGRPADEIDDDGDGYHDDVADTSAPTAAGTAATPQKPRPRAPASRTAK